MISEYIEQLLAAGWIEQSVVDEIKNDLYYRFNMLGFPIRDVRRIENGWVLLSHGVIRQHIDTADLEVRMVENAIYPMDAIATQLAWIRVTDDLDQSRWTEVPKIIRLKTS